MSLFLEEMSQPNKIYELNLQVNNFLQFQPAAKLTPYKVYL